MNAYQRNQMKAAGFSPFRRETLNEWAQRMLEKGHRVDVVTLDSYAEIDWDNYEKNLQHCKDTERE